ncbi:energy transducer TonB [Roseateles sp.]|uniref:energy transducer TonB n=1 Tax=Roseateles sp. TaxID=1971397 RepID=UPI0031D86BFF
MSAPALRLRGGPPRWTGWAIAGAIHAGMLLALASAFAPSPKAPAPVTISARLLPSANAPAVAAPPSQIALPRSMLSVPPMPDIPPPPVQITPAAAIDQSVTSATRPVTAMAVAAAPATTVAVATVPEAAPAAEIPLAALPSETPAALPADHRVCSERQTARHYPALLRERGIQGRVVLRVKVDVEGRASEVVISGGSGWRLLDEAARRVAESCPYIPARRGEQRLVSWVEYPVRFALQPSTLQ